MMNREQVRSFHTLPVSRDNLSPIADVLSFRVELVKALTGSLGIFLARRAAKNRDGTCVARWTAVCRKAI
jgi:hypothetical protein